jgi:hypothetical protein
MSRKIETKQGQKKGGKRRAIKNLTEKREKAKKTLSHKKSKKGQIKRKKNFDQKAIKEKETKIKVLPEKCIMCS